MALERFYKKHGPPKPELQRAAAEPPEQSLITGADSDDGPGISGTRKKNAALTINFLQLKESTYAELDSLGTKFGELSSEVNDQKDLNIANLKDEIEAKKAAHKIEIDQMEEQLARLISQRFAVPAAAPPRRLALGNGSGGA
jgi:hypothetical protein